jgi:hypothetical protein
MAKVAKKTTANPNAKTYAAALAHARKLHASYGPVTVIREITQKYKVLQRRDVLAIAKAVGLNQGTAARQFQEVRSGNISIAA